jgi:hypothetical protein
MSTVLTTFSPAASINPALFGYLESSVWFMPEWIQGEITSGNEATARALNAWALTGQMPGPHAPQSYAELYVLRASIHSEAADVGVRHALRRAINSRSCTPCVLPLALTLPDYPVPLPDYVDSPSDYAPATPTTVAVSTRPTTPDSEAPTGWTPEPVSPVSRSGWTNTSTPDIRVPPRQDTPSWTYVDAEGWLQGLGTAENPIVVDGPPAYNTVARQYRTPVDARCWHCQERGHTRTQCPRRHEPRTQSGQRRQRRQERRHQPMPRMDVAILWGNVEAARDTVGDALYELDLSMNMFRMRAHQQ